MDLSRRKEQFSLAYVRAVAAVAGFAVAVPEVDDDSVDLTLSARNTEGFLRRPKLDLQIKCTSEDILGVDEVVYPLKRKNYDDLRDNQVLVPRLLVVLHVPESIEEWLRHSEQELAMRRCGYWALLGGLPETDNSSSVSIRFPRTQVFDVLGLRDLMANVAPGGLR